MQIKTSGFDELENYLKQLEQNVKDLENTKSVTFDELFIPKFMHQYTSFDTIDDLLLAGGFEVNSSEDFKLIPDDVLDKHISEHTNFSSWQEMLNSAASEYAARKLGF